MLVDVQHGANQEMSNTSSCTARPLMSFTTAPPAGRAWGCSSIPPAGSPHDLQHFLKRVKEQNSTRSSVGTQECFIYFLLSSLRALAFLAMFQITLKTSSMSAQPGTLLVRVPDFLRK